ncbi:hypothetical protein KI387_006686, partial [Taxus chinensis]
KSSSSKLSREAQSAAFDAVKVVGNVHWAAAGLLAIANVLERFEMISANDRDCMDLLKAMLDLAKFLKQLKDMNADVHKQISEKMMEALHLIVSGSIIRDELVYIRRKVDSIIGQLSLQLQVKIASFYMSQQPQCTVAGDMQNPCETEIHAAESENDLSMQELESTKHTIEYALSKQETSVDKSPHMLLRTFLRFRRYLQKIRHSGFQGREKVSKVLFIDTGTSSGIELHNSQLLSFNGRPDYFKTLPMSFNGSADAFKTLPMQFTVEELERATENFRLSVPTDRYSDCCKGTLPSGEQVM